FAVPLLEKYGTKEQKEKYLPEIASGSRTVTLAWLEPGSDYGPLDVQCEGKQTGDKLIINGTKEMVPEADTVDTLLTVVRTSQSDRKEGISLVLIDKELSNNETKQLGKVSFKDINDTKEDVLGRVNQGWEVLEEGLLHLNAAISSSMTGGIEKIVETISEYATIREQFGGPIGRFQ